MLLSGNSLCLLPVLSPESWTRQDVRSSFLLAYSFILVASWESVHKTYICLEYLREHVFSEPALVIIWMDQKFRWNSFLSKFGRSWSFCGFNDTARTWVTISSHVLIPLGHCHESLEAVLFTWCWYRPSGLSGGPFPLAHACCSLLLLFLSYFWMTFSFPFSFLKPLLIHRLHCTLTPVCCVSGLFVLLHRRLPQLYIPAFSLMFNLSCLQFSWILLFIWCSLWFIDTVSCLTLATY